MLILPALRPWWSWITPQTWWTCGILWPLNKTCYGIHDLWSKSKKTVAKFLWQGYISIFRALAKLLSDQGANFKSNMIRELCDLMGIWKVRASPYHAQTSGQVEWAHQMLMCMMGKVSKDWKADWLRHLPELAHAYNSMRPAITRYIPHYLMFGPEPCFPIDFYFPTVRDMKKHKCVDHYIAKLCEWLQEAFKEAQMQSTSEAKRQQKYCDRKANVISLEPDDLVLAKADAYRGGERWRISGRKNHMMWSANSWKASLPTLWKASRLDAYESPTEIDFFLLLWQRGVISVQLCRSSGPGAPLPP